MLGSAYAVFLRVVRRAYAQKGRLNLLASGLQLVVFMAYFSFPSLYNPPAWARFWAQNPDISKNQHRAGFALTVLGMVSAFGTMAWFGIKQAFGVANESLQLAGKEQVLERMAGLFGGSLSGMDVLYASVNKP